MRNLLNKQDPILKKKRKRKILESERIRDALKTFGLGSKIKREDFPAYTSIENIDKSYEKLKKQYFKAKEKGIKSSLYDFLKSKEIEGVKASEVFSSIIKGKGIYKFGMNLPFTSNYKFEWGYEVNLESKLFGETFFYTNDYMGLLGCILVCRLLREGEIKYVTLRPLTAFEGGQQNTISYDKVLNGNTVVYRTYVNQNDIPPTEKFSYAYYDATVDGFDFANVNIESYLYSAAILPERDELYFPRLTTVDGNESLFIQPWSLIDRIPKNDSTVVIDNRKMNFTVEGIIEFIYKGEAMVCLLGRKPYTFPNGERNSAFFVFVMKRIELNAKDDGNLNFNAKLLERFFFPLTKEEYKDSADKFTRIVVASKPKVRGVFKDAEEMETLNSVSKIFYMGGKPDKAISQNVFVPPGVTDKMNLNVKLSVPAAFFVNNEKQKEMFRNAFELTRESGWNITNIKKYIHFYLCTVNSMRAIPQDKRKVLNSIWEYRVYISILAKTFKKTISVMKRILKLQAKSDLEEVYILAKEIADLSAYFQLIYDGVIGDAPIKFLKETFATDELKSEKSVNFLELNFLQIRNSLRAFITYLTDLKEQNRIKSLRDLTGYFMNIYKSISLTNDFVSFNIAYNPQALDETYKNIGSYIEDFDRGKKAIDVTEEVETINNIIEAIQTTLDSIEEKNVKYGEKIKALEKSLVGEVSLDRRSAIKNEISFYKDLLRLRDPERWQLFKDKANIQKQINTFEENGEGDEMKLDLSELGPETMKIIKYAEKFGFGKLPKEVLNKLID